MRSCPTRLSCFERYSLKRLPVRTAKLNEGSGQFHSTRKRRSALSAGTDQLARNGNVLTCVLEVSGSISGREEKKPFIEICFISLTECPLTLRLRMVHNTIYIRLILVLLYNDSQRQSRWPRDIGRLLSLNDQTVKARVRIPLWAWISECFCASVVCIGRGRHVTGRSLSNV